ncbi:MAG: hypothetical protein OER95_16700, partial [Acidimicrobiia bacterium]|nr:hypothetical protein [Acidimicrobiia bacterium]
MTTAPPAAAEAVLVTSMMRSVSVYRFVTAGWAIAGVLIGRAALTHPVWAVALLGLAVATTSFLYWIGRSDPARLVTWPLLAFEVGVGLTLLV